MTHNLKAEGNYSGKGKAGHAILDFKKFYTQGYVKEYPNYWREFAEQAFADILDLEKKHSWMSELTRQANYKSSVPVIDEVVEVTYLELQGKAMTASSVYKPNKGMARIAGIRESAYTVQLKHNDNYIDVVPCQVKRLLPTEVVLP